MNSWICWVIFSLNRDFASERVLAGSKAAGDFRWAGEFYDATNNAFSRAVMWKTSAKRPKTNLLRSTQTTSELNRRALKPNWRDRI